VRKPLLVNKTRGLLSELAGILYGLRIGKTFAPELLHHLLSFSMFDHRGGAYLGGRMTIYREIFIYINIYIYIYICKYIYIYLLICFSLKHVYMRISYVYNILNAQHFCSSWLVRNVFSDSRGY
jgi:hypothetical protein